MEVWFFFDEGTTGREPQMSGEETERIYTRAPPKRVGRALALLTKTYHGSRVTGDVDLIGFSLVQFRRLSRVMRCVLNGVAPIRGVCRAKFYLLNTVLVSCRRPIG